MTTCSAPEETAGSPPTTAAGLAPGPRRTSSRLVVEDPVSRRSPQPRFHPADEGINAFRVRRGGASPSPWVWWWIRCTVLLHDRSPDVPHQPHLAVAALAPPTPHTRRCRGRLGTAGLLGQERSALALRHPSVFLRNEPERPGRDGHSADSAVLEESHPREVERQLTASSSRSRRPSSSPRSSPRKPVAASRYPAWVSSSR
jgi:hypothetical protein